MECICYKLQLYSFLTLLILTIIPKLIEIITGLKIKVELANLLNLPDNWMSGFYASTIIVLFLFHIIFNFWKWYDLVIKIFLFRTIKKLL